MALEYKDWIEIASDILGGVSGVALLVPTYRVTEIRALIHAKQAKLAELDPTVRQGLRSRLTMLDEAASSFEPADTFWLRVGVWALVGAFALKLLFHAVSKFSV